MKKLTYLLSTVFLAFFLFASNPNVYSQDDPFIEVIQPNVSGIEWVIGTTHLISWTDNLTQPVIIQLWKGGVKWYNIEGSATGSTYHWDIPDTLTLGNDYKIRVKSSVDPSISDYGDNTFAIVKTTDPGIRVIQPSEPGIVWRRGTTHMISWTDNIDDPVIIQLWKGGVKWYNIEGSATGSTYWWAIPDTLTIGTDYKIRIKYTYPSGIVSDYSDNDFEVSDVGGNIEVFQPNGGENWAKGTKHMISWTDNLDDPLTIQLWKGGVKWYNIEGSATGSTYWWDIPDTLTSGTDYKIRVKYSSDKVIISDYSDDFFEISSTGGDGFIEVIQPDGSESWVRGTSKLISWTDNLADPVIIQLWKGGVKQYNISGSAEGSTYTWTIPAGQTADDDYKIRVKSSVNPSISDYSDDYFEILEALPGSVTVLQPNVSGIQWARGTTKLISWTDNLTEPLKIELWKGGLKWYEIEASVEGSTYSWSIPDTLTEGTDYMVKLISTLDPSITDQSDNNFEITGTNPNGYIEVIQPNGGEVWKADNAYLISWIDNLTEPVIIQLWKGGVKQYNITGSAEGTTYTWTIPAGQTADDDYKIRVKSTVDPSISDYSDDYFEIIPNVKTAVYPNPCDAYMTVKINGENDQRYTVSLYDRFNTKIMSRSFNSASYNEIELSTVDLPDGIYFINVQSDKTSITRKVMVYHR